MADKMLRGLMAGMVGIALSMTPLSTNAAEQPVHILALGDSLTQGYGVPTGQEFPAQLERALKAKGLNASVINAGVSGDTTAGGLARTDWSLTPKPDAAIVEFGGNDALRGLSPAETEKNLDAMLAKLKAAGVPTLLAGMMSPRNMGADYAKAFDAVFPRLAKKYGVIFYPFFLDGVALKPELLQRDLLHPTPQGVAVIVGKMLPQVLQLVAKAKTTHKPE